MCSNVPSKSVVLCLQVPLDPEILYISHALLVKMFDWGFQFLEWAFVFFRPPAYLFAKKRTLNNELTKGGLMAENVPLQGKIFLLHAVICWQHCI